MTDLSDLIARVEGLGAREQIARIIEPSAWRVMDACRDKWEGDWNHPDQFNHKASLAKADAILALLHALAAKEPS